MRRCTRCGAEHDRKKRWCAACNSETLREWRSRNPEARWEYELARRFNITPEEYHRQLARQGGLCAVCRNGQAAGHDGERLGVDLGPDGRLRGLLCWWCSTAIGKFRDPWVLVRMAAYVQDAAASTRSNATQPERSQP